MRLNRPSCSPPLWNERQALIGMSRADPNRTRVGSRCSESCRRSYQDGHTAGREKARGFLTRPLLLSPMRGSPV